MGPENCVYISEYSHLKGLMGPGNCVKYILEMFKMKCFTVHHASCGSLRCMLLAVYAQKLLIPCPDQEI